MPSYTRIKRVADATTERVMITYRSLTPSGKPVLGTLVVSKEDAANIYIMPKALADITTIYGLHEVHP